MTKEEKIKEAYGEYFNELSDIISDDGWVSFHEDKNRLRNVFHNNENIEVSPNDNNNWRPKSLQGIENNNGWTKIETKEDLPEHWGEYDVVIRGKIGRATYLRNDMWLVDGNDYPKKTSDHCITHYEQKIKRELPLY
jgi:hypothetical protein